MNDLYNSGLDDVKLDKDLEQFLLVEKQKAQFNAQVFLILFPFFVFVFFF